MGTSIAGRSGLNPRRHPHLAIVFGFLSCVLVHHQSHAAATDLSLLKTAALFGQLSGMNERRTADNLIKHAREYMDEGNLELAEWYVEKAEKLNVKYNGLWSRFTDTPQKLREDLLKLSAKKKLADAAKQFEPPTPSQQFQPQPVAAGVRQSHRPVNRAGHVRRAGRLQTSLDGAEFAFALCSHQVGRFWRCGRRCHDPSRRS